jgi:hypothetical protein
MNKLLVGGGEAVRQIEIEPPLYAKYEAGTILNRHEVWRQSF